MKFKSLLPLLMLTACTTVSTDTSAEKDWIRKAMKFKMNDYWSCFSENYGSKPDTAGKYTLQWTLDTEGKVTTAEPVPELTTLPKSNLFNDCMIGVLKEIPFPTSESELTVRYPFNFSFQKQKSGETPPPKN